MLPSIFIILNDFVFIIEAIKAYLTFSCTSETFVIKLKLRFIHSAGLMGVKHQDSRENKTNCFPPDHTLSV